VGLPDEEYGERVVAAVVREGQDLTDAELINLCRQDLAGYKRPREIMFVEELPRNALGKVQKHLVRDQLVNSEEKT
jgi:malonyl-CoA/methylmalonyl-CoA synthetase